MLGNTSLTFEELSTVLAQIEGCLNSRPLCRLSEDPNDDQILTPGHFLIGTSINTLPEGPVNTNSYPISRWNFLNQLKHQFWQRWSKEYLVQLQNRPKWKSQEYNLKIGDIVILKENNMPPCKWPLGKIISTHTGPDNLIRVVSIQTPTNTIIRPIHKTCLLPINNSLSEK